MTPLYLFDINSIIEADLAIKCDDAWPDLSLYNGVQVWERYVDADNATDRLLNVLNAEKIHWRWLGYPQELIIYIRELRTAIKAPIHEQFREGLTDCLALGEEEAARRLRVIRARLVRGDRYPSWEGADLVAEVEAVCGPGVRRAKNILFRCCFHDDHNPSLSVNPAKSVWYCHPCARGGGVVAWRQAIEVAA